MTELETMKRAKLYLDKLANGINPLDDTAIPDDDIVNHVRISRCLFYVSGVLGQVIDNGGVTPPPKVKRSKKIPFALPFEKRINYRISDWPISLTEVSHRISELSEVENMKNLTYKPLHNWLVEIGMLENVTGADGRKRSVPTLHGTQLGITTEERTGQRGTYHVTVYNQNAQQFILDNLDAILAMIE